VSAEPAPVEVYNTRTRRKERLVPLEPGHVRVYSCGPTVYAPQHLGNMRPYVFADLLKRVLLDAGYRVTHVINITDVGHLTNDSDDGDDKMELAARQAGLRAEDIAERYTAEWKRDLERLHCLPADIYCKATEHIAEQIELGLSLERGGYTYRTADGIYFDTSRFERYAEFARLDLEGQRGGARIGEVEEKRHPADFAIWKFAGDTVSRQQEWDSPWGRGFPGWHLECSAMSSRYLGRRFDVHTGGIDHVPVHHTNEIAQSECGFGVSPWVTYWMHNEFIDFKGEKMAKSTGNVALLQDLVDAGIEPLAFRYFLLQAQYRQQLAYNDEAMASARTGYRRLVAAAAEVRDAAGEGDPAAQAPLLARFRDAMRDDLNSPRAMAVVWEVARSELPAADRRDLLGRFDAVLGLDLAHAEAPEAGWESDPRIDALLAERDEARAARDFERADAIRDELAAEGVEVIDTPEGGRWRRSG